MEDDKKRVVLSQEEFRKNIEAMYELCEAWFRGEVKHSEFDEKEWTILTHRTKEESNALPVDCKQGDTEQEQRVAKDLKSEFARTGNFTNCISMTAAEMEEKGYDDSASPLTRAFFFARHWWPDLARANADAPPILLVSTNNNNGLIK